MCKIQSKRRVVYLRSFISTLLRTVLFPGLSLTETKCYKNFFPQFPFFLMGFLNQISNKRQMRLLYWRRKVSAQGTNLFCANAEHFHAGDEHIENKCSNLIHTHTASYQRLPHRYSTLKTGGSFHAIALTTQWATPTSYICNSIL